MIKTTADNNNKKAITELKILLWKLSSFIDFFSEMNFIIVSLIPKLKIERDAKTLLTKIHNPYFSIPIWDIKIGVAITRKKGAKTTSKVAYILFLNDFLFKFFLLY